MNPYLVLKVAAGSGDDAIRAAYLTAVKSAPPDHSPREFQAINEAYEQIKDERSRHAYMLYDRTPPGESPLDTLIQFVRLRPNRSPMPHETMKTFLRACTKIQ